MQTVVSESDPLDDVLLREGDVTITSSRLEINKTTYALKYIATVTLQETHPPREEARMVFLLGLAALITVVVYAVTGKVSISSFLVFFGLALLAAAIGGMVYWLDPSRYTLDLKMINGEQVQISNKSERYIHRIHKALRHSLAVNSQAPIVVDAHPEVAQTDFR